MAQTDDADLIVTNARISTLDTARPEARAMATRDGRITAVGDEAEILARRSARTTVVDAQRRRVIPGLNDSHIHVIRGGLNYNMELRWDGVPSLPRKWAQRGSQQVLAAERGLLSVPMGCRTRQVKASELKVQIQ